MTTTDKALEKLFTGDETMNERLRAAFALGIEHGVDADRNSTQRAAQIDTTQRILATLMRSQGSSLENAMIDLQIPRKDRDIYRKIFSNKAKQKRDSQP